MVEKNTATNHVNVGRKEEEYAKDLFIDFFHRQLMSPKNVIANPTVQGTHPDYVFVWLNREVVVEITKSGTGFISELKNALDDERIENECHVLSTLDKACKNGEILSWLEPGHTVILFISNLLPSINRKILKKFDANLRTEFMGKFLYHRAEIPLGQVTTTAQLTDYYSNIPEYSRLKIIYGPSLSSENLVVDNNLLKQARYILKHNIKNKDEKYTTVTLPKWLCIINIHPLLTLEIYKEAYYSLSEEGFTHTFEKIFLIYENAAYCL